MQKDKLNETLQVLRKPQTVTSAAEILGITRQAMKDRIKALIALETRIVMGETRTSHKGPAARTYLAKGEPKWER